MPRCRPGLPRPVDGVRWLSSSDDRRKGSRLVTLPVRGYPDIYVNRVTLIRESGEAETLVEFEGDKREAIALPIEKVRELIDQAMSSMATTRAGDTPTSGPALGRGLFSVEGTDLAIFAAARYGAEN
jgi:hypothetical protein